jgi:FixJ family two-component response regulator
LAESTGEKHRLTIAPAPRQHQIMHLVLAGHPSKNIASDLGIAKRTVEKPSRLDHEENRLDVYSGLRKAG